MADNIIQSDMPLTEAQRDTLSALLDALIPASPDGTMPSAATMDFITWLRELEPTALADTRMLLDAAADLFTPVTTGALATEAIDKLASADSHRFRTFADQVLACYYTQDVVLTALGAKPGAPFPDGNTVAQSDLTLLDPVIARGKIWRDA